MEMGYGGQEAGYGNCGTNRSWAVRLGMAGKRNLNSGWAVRLGMEGERGGQGVEDGARTPGQPTPRLPGQGPNRPNRLMLGY